MSDSRAMAGTASVPEMLDDTRNGRMLLLVEDNGQRSAGALFVAAPLATPTNINFMATHARGLICLALPQRRIAELALPMQPVRGDRGGENFAVSIEAREGVTTGISAADRALTIATAIDSPAGSDRLVTPGHVFPVAASDGGVLIRAGHAEAAVDLTRLTGIKEAGVFCKVLDENGEIAGRAELERIAERHDLKIAHIADVIRFRRNHDRLIEQRAEAVIDSRWGGAWRSIVFVNRVDGSEQLALVKGDIAPDRPTLVRMHTLSYYTDIFGDRTDRSGLVELSMRMIADAGAGVIVLLNRSRPGILEWMTRVRSTVKTADEKTLSQVRDFGIGAQILAELGVRDIVLLTNTKHSIVGLSGFGLNIVGELPLPTVDR